MHPLRYLGAVTAGLAVVISPLAAQTTAVPAIQGPIASTAESGEAFRGSNEQPIPGPGLPMPDLEKIGYEQQEYFISGMVDGKAYLTSLLVRRPKDMSRFSGLVGVETIHAGGAIPFWGVGREVWAPGGHGWVGVASQRISVEQRVKPFNPKRYAMLNIPEAAPGSGNEANGGPQDRISQAIMTQVGRLLKSNLPNGPFAGKKVRYLLMGGASQTGGTTFRYIEQSNATAKMPDGRPIYDGFLPAENFTVDPLTGGGSAIVHVAGEGDFKLFSAVTEQPGFTIRPDSDSPHDRYREFEYPAASHVVTRGKTTTEVPGEHPSQFPNQPFYKMALLHLIDWVVNGTPPPHAARIERANGQIVRDAFGNAKGGIRSPYLDVPAYHYITNSPIINDDHTRLQRGLQERLSDEQLHRLYASRDDYLSRFDRGLDKDVAEGWLLAPDAAKLKADEAKAPPF